MVISSRTPEGQPNRCPVCGNALAIESSVPPGDAPCPRCGHLLWFTSEDLGDVRVIKPTGHQFYADSLDRLQESGAFRKGTRLVLDLSDVPYLASADLGKLVELSKLAQAVRGRVRLRGVHPELRHVFRVCRLDQLFEIEA